MKKVISIIILMIFGVSYGQDEGKPNSDKLVIKSTYWITDKCSDLDNHYENDLCVRNEINQFVNINLNWSLVDNLPNGEYEIRMNLMVDENGGISKATAKSEYEELNNELERILILFQNKIKLIDQNGNAYKTNMIFPLKFIVE